MHLEVYLGTDDGESVARRDVVELTRVRGDSEDEVAECLGFPVSQGLDEAPDSGAVRGQAGGGGIRRTGQGLPVRLLMSSLPHQLQAAKRLPFGVVAVQGCL